MKAALFYGARDVRIESVPEPDGKLGPYEVLLRNHECGICGTDLHEYADGPLQTVAGPHPLTGECLPITLGHEFSATVLATGDAVTTVETGHRVAVQPQVFCGQCSQCRAGRQQNCQTVHVVGLHTRWAGLAEYAVLGEAQVARLPNVLSDAAGALVEPTAVAVHAVASAPVRPGDAVLIAGGGPIGLLVAMAARACGAGKVILTEPSEGRRAVACRIGAIDTIDPVHEDALKQISDRTDGVGVDVAFECAGAPSAFETCLQAVRAGGMVVQTAVHARPVSLDVTKQLVLRDVTLRGCYCYQVTSWPRVMALIANASIPAEQIITRKIELDELVDAGFEPLLAPGSSEVKILVRLS